MSVRALPERRYGPPTSAPCTRYENAAVQEIAIDPQTD